MRYYIVTTTNFSDNCIAASTYGATHSNWLANLNIGDFVFISQFNYRGQNLFGPFRVSKTLFHNKTIIYPHQRFFYRIQFDPVASLRMIEETDLYLAGIRSGRVDLYFRLINLIQQNKHLHCISLTNQEGEAILNAFEQNGVDYHPSLQPRRLAGDLIEIDPKYIWGKNKLDRKYFFSAESDLESYIILSLKQAHSVVYECLNTLLSKYPDNDLGVSTVYNQFIFGNAYPADVVILNEDNINVLELKKDKLAASNVSQIEKEMKKHLYYSLLSNRIEPEKMKRFSFYLVFLRNENNGQFKGLIYERFRQLCRGMIFSRENNLTFVEYSVKDDDLILEEL